MYADVSTILLFWGIPSAITGAIVGLGVWQIQKNLKERDMERKEIENARKKNELLLIKGVGAAIALGEATAKSIQRLDPNCNGDMKEALEYARKVKHEQKDFLHEQGVENFY